MLPWTLPPPVAHADVDSAPAHGPARPWMVPRLCAGGVRCWMFSELLDDLGGDGAGCGAGLRARGPGRSLRGTVRGPAGRRDRHGRLQRDAGVLAAHRAAVNQPAAIRLPLGHGDAWPAWLQVRGEATAIARWPDHDASVALPGHRSRRNSRRADRYADRQPFGD